MIVTNGQISRKLDWLRRSELMRRYGSSIGPIASFQGQLPQQL